MNYGLYLSASGVLSNLYRQDVYANNLANVETVGFKRDLASIAQRDPEVIEGQFGGELANELLDRLGGGALAGPQHTIFAPAPLKATTSPFDVALETEKTFFSIAATDPLTGEAALRLTRDGRFSRNEEGFLVTIAGGHRVLGENDQPIQLGPEPIDIDSAGRVFQNGAEIARLRVARVENPSLLFKVGQGQFAWNGGDLRQDTDNPGVRQGYVEASGVDPIKTLMQLIDATKAATTNANMIRYHDTILDRAVNTLGRIA